jgi:CDP-diacylglycerol---serine O-phosphatidyltransferase
MNPANLLTLLSAASAILGLYSLLVVGGPVATAVSLTCIGASLILDRVDGVVARRLGISSAMGAQLDSLADLLAFGVLPAAVVVSRYPGPVMALLGLLYTLAAVWRLARYDGGELQVGRWGPAFLGLPTSAAACLVVSAITLADQLPATAGWGEGALVLVAAAGMPSTLRYPKAGIGAWPWMISMPCMILAQWWGLRAGG